MSTSYSFVELTWIPEGYLAIEGPNDRIYVVPEFFVMTLIHAFQTMEKMGEMETDKAAGTVRISFSLFFKGTASGWRDSKFIFVFFRRQDFRPSFFGIFFFRPCLFFRPY